MFGEKQLLAIGNHSAHLFLYGWKPHRDWFPTRRSHRLAKNSLLLGTGFRTRKLWSPERQWLTLLEYLKSGLWR